MVHLIYCDNKEKELEKILSNQKMMVIRGASGRKILHSRVFSNEILYFMEKGSKMISAQAKVVHVENYVKINDSEILQILEANKDKLKLSSTQKQRWHKKCLVLVEFDYVQKIGPYDFDHQKNMDDWLILEKIEDVIVNTSNPYNYEKSKFK